MQQMMRQRNSQIQGTQDDDVKNLGEGSERMVQKSMEKMSIGATVSYGAVTLVLDMEHTTQMNVQRV